MRKVLILINAKAGTGKAGSRLMQIVTEAAKAGYEPLVFPILPGTELSSEHLIGAYGRETDLILCSGGDGTLNHVMNAIMSLRRKPVLAYLPAGSTNDFAKGLGIPSNKQRALEAALYGGTYAYDVGSINGRYFNYVAAFGAFTEISYDTKQEWKNVLGYAAYFLSAIVELHANIRYSQHLVIETEQGTEEGDYVFGAVCNSASVGGLPLFGKAGVKLNDGKMELLLIKAPKNLLELQGMASILRKGVSNHPGISFKQITHVTFKSEKDLAWTVDGEFGGSYKESAIRVHKHAITIMTNGV